MHPACSPTVSSRTLRSGPNLPEDHRRDRLWPAGTPSRSRPPSHFGRLNSGISPGRGASSQQPYLTLRSAGSGEPLIGRQELAPQGFGQRDVGRVVSSHGIAQLVGPAHQAQRGVAVDGEVLKVAYGSGKSDCRDGLSQPSLSKDCHGFNVNEIGCRDIASYAELLSSSLPIGSVVTDHVGKHRRINNNHRSERSSETSLAAWVKPTRPPRRFSIRSSTSSTLGRSANRVNSAARYCCRDWPRLSARS